MGMMKKRYVMLNDCSEVLYSSLKNPLFKLEALYSSEASVIST